MEWNSKRAHYRATFKKLVDSGEAYWKDKRMYWGKVPIEKVEKKKGKSPPGKPPEKTNGKPLENGDKIPPNRGLGVTSEGGKDDSPFPFDQNS
jgi:hypothetical protein